MKLVRALLGALVISAGVTATGVAQAPEPSAAATRTPATETSLDTVPALTTTTPFRTYWELGSAQQVLPRTILLTRDGHEKSRGTRSDSQFFQISRTGGNDVPAAALRAYKHAEKVMATSDPGCHISWTLLAAIGRVESNHGRFGGAQLGSDGVSRPEIRGPRLDGAGAFAAIADSDHGQLDRDKVWDRAVGQMQFLPTTWASVARDGDGDGKKNPDDIDDSALGAAVYLCGAGGSLADAAGMSRAAFRYNHSDYYVSLVLSFQAGYATGVFTQPSPPPPATSAVHKAAGKAAGKAARPTKKPTRAAQHQSATVTTPAPAPTTTPAPRPKPKPTPKPRPTPKPTPTAPVLTNVTGTWSSCGLGFCLGSTPLDLGGADVASAQASADFDGDGATETNSQEFAGLVGKQVALRVERKAGSYVVYVIRADGFRNADGSLARFVAASATSTP